MKLHDDSLHPVAIVRKATRRRAAGSDEAGFTLIELIVVVAILPIVVGGLAMALLSVFGLQNQTFNRVTDSNDEQIASVSFNRDVQSAQQLTTQSTPGCGTSAQTQLLGLEWGPNSSAPGGFQTVVSYVVNTANTTARTMFRQVCTAGTSTVPSSSNVVSHDIGSNPTLTCNTLTTSTLCITGSGADNPLPDESTSFGNWASAQGVTGITFKIVAPGSSYTYSLVGVPGLSTSQGFASNLQAANGQGCNFASSGSGTYANHLCFADFAGFNAANYIYPTCDTMQRPIAGTPYTLQFCLSVNSTSVAPAAIPTYYNPSGNNSEAFLGNNGFYTGIAGDPALYTDVQGAVVTAYFTNIQVLDSAGNPATGWTLVTGDAESTDGGEWNVYTSNLNWSILPNNGSSDLWGNACYDTSDANNNGALQYTGTMPATATSVSTQTAALSINTTTYATGVPSIICAASTSLNKTGTMMLQAQEPSTSHAAQTLTVTMNGTGLQAIFLGVLL